MPANSAKPVFLVDAGSDPVVVRIEGRANFKNCSCLRDFVTTMIHSGKRRFIFDFKECDTVDSTFLGVLAGAAIELKKSVPSGSLVAARVEPRNLELMRNLGLHRLLRIDGAAAANLDRCDTALVSPENSEVETARLVLKAHENLVQTDAANEARFQDVVAFMRDRVAQG